MSEIRWVSGGGVIGELQRKGLLGAGEQPAPEPIVEENPIVFEKSAPLPEPTAESKELDPDGGGEIIDPEGEIVDPDDGFVELDEAEDQVAEVALPKNGRGNS